MLSMQEKKLFARFFAVVYERSFFMFFILREAAKNVIFFSCPANKGYPLELSGHIFWGNFLELKKYFFS